MRRVVDWMHFYGAVGVFVFLLSFPFFFSLFFFFLYSHLYYTLGFYNE